MVLLAALWAVFSWPGAATASDMGKMIERIAILTGLPETAEPSAVREAPLSEIIKHTGKDYARAAYLRRWRHIIYAPGYEWWVPHEVTHMLQVDAGEDPGTDENEKQAQWVQSIFWRLFPPKPAAAKS